MTLILTWIESLHQTRGGTPRENGGAIGAHEGARGNNGGGEFDHVPTAGAVG
jgi:hypothetical protein